MIVVGFQFLPHLRGLRLRRGPLDRSPNFGTQSNKRTSLDIKKSHNVRTEIEELFFWFQIMFQTVGKSPILLH
jgi:hypothetical protein